jgi:hypothetical protein
MLLLLLNVAAAVCCSCYMLLLPYELFYLLVLLLLSALLIMKGYEGLVDAECSQQSTIHADVLLCEQPDLLLICSASNGSAS